MLFEDVLKLCQNYLTTSWTTTPISYPGIIFDTTTITKWIQMRIQDLSGIPQRQTTRQTRIVVIIHVYIKVSTSQYELQTLCSTIASLFHNKTLQATGFAIRFKETTYSYLGESIFNFPGFDTATIEVEGTVQ